MSHSSDAEGYIIAEWRAALIDAGVAEDDFHLITCPGAAVTGHAKAVSFDKGLELSGDHDEGGIVAQPHKLAEANDPENVWRHRVAIYEDIDEADPVELAYVAGVLRHEIEHAKQRDAAHEAFGLYDIVDIACSKAAAGDTQRYRDLLNAAPIEADANAAASAHVRKRYPDLVGDLAAGSDHYLVDPTHEPHDTRTLTERTVDYLWLLRDVCDDPANLEPGKTFAEILDNRVPGAGAGDRWRRLQQEGRG